jgi:ABC-type nitrate/sulfonate/bicarbonate transport system permease component
MAHSKAMEQIEGLDEATLERRADRRDRWLTAATFLVLFSIWVALTGSGLREPFIKPLFLPSPLAVFEAFQRLLEDGYQGRSLAHHVGISFYRFATAFSFCILFGVPLGLLLGMSRPIRAVIEPPIQAIRPVPKLALLPLFLIWFGIGNLSKIVVIAAPVFPIIVISAMQAVRSVSQKKIQAAQALGASTLTVFRRVVLPASLPGIFTGIRVSLSIGVTMLVGAELTATSEGIAWMALTAAEYLSTDIVLVGVLIMAIMGYTLDRIVRTLEGRLVHWSGKD